MEYKLVGRYLRIYSRKPLNRFWLSLDLFIHQIPSFRDHRDNVGLIYSVSENSGKTSETHI